MQIYRLFPLTGIAVFYPLVRSKFVFLFHKNSRMPLARGKLAFYARWLQKDKEQGNPKTIMEKATKSNAKSGLEKARHKGGAPRKKVKREKDVRVRLTATERFLIDSKAKAAGMRLSNWFRAAAKSAKVVPRLSTDDLGILRMLTGLANNLNQLTKLAHQLGLLAVIGKCWEVINKIDQTIKYLNKDDRESNDR